jgi:L-ribulose-5-phosphate 3-epimerase
MLKKAISRRSFLAGAALSTAAGATRSGALRIGVTDWNLQQTGKLEAVSIAKNLGFDGVQVSLGRRPVDNKLPLDNAEVQAQYLQKARQESIALAGTCLDILHTNYLKNDVLGQKWVADSIVITKNLGAQVVLLPFFGKGALVTHAEMDYVGDALKELAPEAEKAQVILGLEDTISAEDNVRILDRVKSKAVLVYYDVGNSTNGGFDVVKEIRWLGRERICQFHLKDDPHYLGEGAIDLRSVMQAIRDIRFEGFANLETSSPTKSVDRDMRRNLQYVRGLMA